MNRNFRTAMFATIATVITSLVAFVPGLNILALIVVMLPLWFIHNFGIFNLGSENNGFFIPNMLGWGVIGIVLWLCWFGVFLAFRSRP